MRCPLPERLILSLLLSLGAGLSAPVVADERSVGDLSQLPLDVLVNTEVASATTIAQQISDSPAAVAIVTAEDIRDYGYRTLADVINSMRGLYTTYDRKYEYMGGRGFGKPGDYAGRIMLLINGYATQDSLYNQAYIDNSGLIDLELVERVEYVPGTGSATYGNNALLGIINIVTKQGIDFNGAQIGAEWSNRGTQKQRLTYGKRLENGADVLFSASRLDSVGQDFYFPGHDAPQKNNGLAQKHDGEKADRLFGRLEQAGLTLEGGYASRKKYIPTAPAKTIAFNAPYSTWDDNAYLRAKYETDLNLHLKSATQFYTGYYADQALRQYADATDNILYRKNDSRGRWMGLDQKFVGTWLPRHTMVFGAEFRRDYYQRFYKAYLNPNFGIEGTSQQNFDRNTASLYFTDEYSLNDHWKLNLGARYDRASDAKDKFSPRVAAVYNPTRETTLKAAYSEAFRLPSADDRDSFGSHANSEYVKATEFLIQHQPSPDLRLTGTLYHYKLYNQVYYNEAAQDYLNTGHAHTKGLELELEKTWQDGMRLRTSTAWQQAIDAQDHPLINSPRFLGKFNLSVPFLGQALRSGIEGQYLGTRKTLTGRDLDGVATANLTLTNSKPWHGLWASLSIKNVFDKKVEAVAPFTMTAPSGYVQDTLRMDGRTLWLQLKYDL